MASNPLRSTARVARATEPASRAAGSGDLGFRVVMILLHAVSLAVVGWLFIDGLPYYTTPVVERPHHPDYRALGPGGVLAHGLGILGSLMLLSLLLYSLRKRWRRLARLGSTAKWLRVHMYFGIFGPLFITLHSSFKITGIVAVSYWSMIAVALSGVFGRYLYREIPRTILGRALTPSELEEERRRLDERLRERYRLDSNAFRELDRIGGGAGGDSLAARGFVATLRFLFLSNLRIRRGTSALAADLAGRENLDAPARRELTRLFHERALLHRRSVLLVRVREIFHWWHVIHRPFAYVMLTIMFVHIGVAVALGYTWIF
jgi:hypothetical protein